MPWRRGVLDNVRNLTGFLGRNLTLDGGDNEEDVCTGNSGFHIGEPVVGGGTCAGWCARAGLALHLPRRKAELVFRRTLQRHALCVFSSRQRTVPVCRRDF